MRFPSAARATLFHLLPAALAVASAFARVAAATEGTGALKVVLVGDSTVAIYRAEEKTRGWGMYLPQHFGPRVAVLNRAVGGRSSKSYQREGWWGKVLREKPAYVLIQFGHNDGHAAGTPEHTEAEGDFQDCLRLYVRTAREIGARPIFVTPVCMRHFLPDGRFKDDLERYARAMREVAQAERVTLVDLNELSGQLYERLGREACAQFASEPGDTVHFNDLGAWAMAEIVARELRRLEPSLAREMPPSRPARTFFAGESHALPR
jgi:lysophospholipase L1-like esterase